MWMVTSYAHVRDVYRDHERFSSVGRNIPGVRSLPPALLSQLPLVELVESMPALDSANPPDHTNQRADITRPLASRNLVSHEDDFTSECNLFVDRLSAEPKPDLMKHFSEPLAYKAIFGLFGAAPSELAPLYAELASARRALATLGGSDPGVALRYERALTEFRDALESTYPSIDAQDANTTIIASLLHPPPTRTRLSSDEMFAVIRTFLGAALDNIALSIPAAVLALLEHPEQLAIVRADSAMASLAYEETLRWNVPVHSNRRIARIDVELGGKLLRAGDHVMVFKASANHDPAHWDSPDRFDILRGRPSNGGTMSFGQGLHLCSGAGLARLFAPLAINVLLERYPTMRLLEGWRPTWHDVAFSRMLTELPVALQSRH
jgi:cytochrome P450